MTNNLSKVKKMALWIAFVWLLFCLLGAFGNSWYFLIVVCLALLAAIICLFKGLLNAKYAWTVFVISFFLPFIMIGTLASSEDDTTEHKKQEEQKSTVITENAKESAKKKTEIVEKKQDSQLSPKEKEVADAGYKKGSLYGMAGSDNNEFSNMLDLADHVDGMDSKVDEVLEEMAGHEYDNEYNTPSNSEQEKLKKIYIDNFIKGMNETMDAMNR